MRGIILSMIAGKYEVYLENGQTITYSPRGKLRHLKVNLVVGDKVEIENDVISKVEERENFLYRPRIANVDLVMIIQSLSEPDFSSYLLDKFLTLVNIYHLKPCIILTKEDLYDEEKVKSIVEDYQSLNIDVISFHRGDTDKIALIKDKIRHKVVALCGQTGAGKSTLINQLFPEFNRKEGEFSLALKRGKHQTKEVKLLPYNEGFIADTPGFSSLELNIYKEVLKDYFPFFSIVKEPCFFQDCVHINEKGCKVKEALENGIIKKIHYENYLAIYDELIYRKERFS